jgi:DNA-binding beta-propeller fold protein YncE
LKRKYEADIEYKVSPGLSIPAWTPDGKHIIVSNWNSSTVSIVDVELALGNSPQQAEIARIPLTRAPYPDGVVRPANPKGVAITSDGRHAVVSGGPRLDPSLQPSGYVWVIDLQTFSVVATVTGIGNDPYGLTLLENCFRSLLFWKD